MRCNAVSKDVQMCISASHFMGPSAKAQTPKLASLATHPLFSDFHSLFRQVQSSNTAIDQHCPSFLSNDSDIKTRQNAILNQPQGACICICKLLSQVVSACISSPTSTMVELKSDWSRPCARQSCARAVRELSRVLSLES
jgi:hypothetical protein